MGVVKQKCSNCGAELDLYAENIILYCPCCAHELHSQKKEEPENMSEIIEAGIHSAQTERWMEEIRERYGLTDDSNNDDPLSGTSTKNKEITCPNCHTKLILTTTKELRYCPCCAKELTGEENSVPNSFEWKETEDLAAADGRKPVAVYSPKQYRKSSQTRQNSHISPNKRRNVKKPSLSEQIRDALFFFFFGCSVLFCLLLLIYIEENRIWLYVVGFVAITAFAVVGSGSFGT